MPRVASLLDPNESGTGHTTNRPELIKLYLPSHFSPDDRPGHCDPMLVTKEARLRLGALSEALDDVRHQLRFRTYMNKWKIKNVKGQRPNTRARSVQDRIEGSVKRAAETYRLHYKAYFQLVGEGAWQQQFRELKDDDLRGLGERIINEIESAEEERVRELVRARKGGVSSGESRYMLPWIWYSVGRGLDGEDVQIGDGMWF